MTIQIFDSQQSGSQDLLCVRLEKNSLRVGQKEKLLGAQDQRLVCDGIERWPERLLNITANYITTLLEAPHQRNHQSETFTSKSSSAG
ncbi:MAG: hypothetical protein CMP48_09425 [Rickettsiales bacterium]|nr:hypothetical protein [Rickettsiales bacterium]